MIEASRLANVSVNCRAPAVAFQLGSICAVLRTTPRALQTRPPIPSRPAAISEKEPRFGAAHPWT
jgi:hypothetical protein